jgi:hypothetical protein
MTDRDNENALKTITSIDQLGLTFAPATKTAMLFRNSRAR